MGALFAFFLIGSLVQLNGPVRAIEPQLTALISSSVSWYGLPLLAVNTADQSGVYVVGPEVPVGNRFAAVRIDANTGEETTSGVLLGPESPFRAFAPASVHAEIQGVHFQRPAIHLMAFPGGQGPGVHLVDSATGRIRIVLDGDREPRPLLTSSAVNSSRTAELLSLVSADPLGRWIAALSRNSAGWTLYLFSRSTPSIVT